MTSYPDIYRLEAERYAEFVSYEDYAGNLRRIVEGCCSDLTDVVELAAGTGRLTAWLAPLARSVRAFDIEPAMVAAGAARLRSHRNVSFAVADMRDVPLADGSADLVIEGWGGGHLAMVEGAHPAADALCAEMERLARPGATLLIVDALGTNATEARVPNDTIAEFYARLEHYGFDRTEVRTDYRFASADQAAEYVGWFFGAAMAGDVRAAGLPGAAGSPVVPEVTGVWALPV